MRRGNHPETSSFRVTQEGSARTGGGSGSGSNRPPFLAWLSTPVSSPYWGWLVAVGVLVAAMVDVR